MKINVTTLGERHIVYAAPEATVTEMSSEGILCYSTERLEEDDFNPWA